MMLPSPSPSSAHLSYAAKVVPCKPLFFDLARNYVEFPNLEERRKVKSTGTMGAVSGMFSGAVKGLSSFWGR